MENSDQLRRLVHTMLESLGYVVVEADSGPRALALVESGQFKVDLLLTDLVMPEMSGRELVQILNARQADLKVLMMSGYTDDIIVRHGVVEDAYNFLQKPCSRLALAQKVRATLDAT